MMRLTASWLHSPPARNVMGALAAAGHRAYFVGGCVRNALLDHPVGDLDMATDALPEQVIAAAEGAGLRAVPTGLAHGTITVVDDSVAPPVPIEVTTFRADVATDGRRAEVRFSTDLAEDARRRDFTMNALYCNLSGDVVDPLDGLADLRARRLRFVGDAGTRVREDYLRILRFFRFHAWYADPAGGVDAEGLAACAAEAEGLERVSAERIGHEMRKLLAAPDPAKAIGAMAQAGILARVLPGAATAPLFALLALAQGAPDPLLRLAALGGEEVPSRLRLSRAEARRLRQLTEDAATPTGPAELAWRRGGDHARAVAWLRAAITGTGLPADLEGEIAKGSAATFPLEAADLMPDLRGAALGTRLAELEEAWIASGFVLSRAQLLSLSADRGR